MHHFTPVPALLGGILIGLSASLLLFSHGKIAGISGILGGLLSPQTSDRSYRLWFLAGLLVAGIGLRVLYPAAFAVGSVAPLGAVAVAGLLVGFGTRLGNGCTSGHGVCGLSRFSPRSLAATVTFMATGATAVFVSRHVLNLGGGQ
jgi:hypothetical protein